MEDSFFFNEAKAQIFESYPSIFREAEGEGRSNLNRLTKYGWYNALYMASEGNLDTMMGLENKKVYEVFTFINYKIDYQKEHFKNNNV